MAFDVTVLVDNRTERADLTAQAGLSLLLRSPAGSLLVDTGASGDVLGHNADALKIDLAQVHQAVLTHGHCDHGGGLGALLKRCGSLKLYCGAGAFVARYAERPGEPLQRVSMPYSISQLEALGARIIEVNSRLQLTDQCLISGPIGGPPWGGESFAVRSGDELVTDHFIDELFVMARAAAGWVVVVGCCHRGLVNTLRLARFLAHNEPIAAIIGGLHLQGATEKDLQETAAVLVEFDRPALYLGHCTPSESLNYLGEYYGGAVHPLGVGTVISF